MHTKVTIFALLLFIYFPCFTQNSTQQNQKNIFETQANFKEHIIAAGEMIGLDLLVYDVNNLFLLNKPIQTSFQVFKDNLNSPWIWDFSSFNRNQLFHPYLGSLYFNAGRANNLNFYESLALAFAGSFLYETYFEGPTVSKNDLITTTFAGAIYGEILHRLYFSSFNTVPYLSWIISPMDGINLFIKGKNAINPQGNIYNMSISTLFGVNNCIKNYTTSDSTVNASLGAEIFIVYNNPYGHTSKEFYDQFTFDILFTSMIRSTFTRILADGALYSHSIFAKESQSSSIGISFDYDFYNTYDFTLSDSSSGIFYKQQNLLKNNSTLSFSIQSDFVFLSTSDIFYMLNDKNNSYTLPKNQSKYTYKYGPQAKINFDYENAFINFTSNLDYQYLNSYKNSSIDKNLESTINLFIMDNQIEYKINNRFSLGIKDIFYYKNEKNINDFSSSILSNSLLVYSKFVLF